MLTLAADWSEVTAIATSILAIGALGALAALESQGAFDLELIKLLAGRTLIERWELWRPALHETHGPGVYPMFEGLAAKLRRELDDPVAVAVAAADG